MGGAGRNRFRRRLVRVRDFVSTEPNVAFLHHNYGKSEQQDDQRDEHPAPALALYFAPLLLLRHLLPFLVRCRRPLKLSLRVSAANNLTRFEVEENSTRERGL